MWGRTDAIQPSARSSARLTRQTSGQTISLQARQVPQVREIHSPQPKARARARNSSRTCTLSPDKLYAERCREVPNAGLSGQGGRVRSSDDDYKIATGQSSIPQTGGHVSGTCAGRGARKRSIVEKDRENEPDMTTYPLDFHRRSEQ